VVISTSGNKNYCVVLSCLLAIAIGLLGTVSIDNAYATITTVVINSPTAGQSFDPNFSIDYDVNDDGANGANNGRIEFTRTGGTPDPGTHRYTMDASDYTTGNHVITRATLESDPSFPTLVGGAEYTIIVRIVDMGPKTDTELVVTADFPPPETKSKGNSSSHKWKTKPTFGLSHNPGKQVINCGFKMGSTCYDITDNFHTEFDKVTINTGSTHDFAMKTSAQYGLKRVEFAFVPEVGLMHKAEVIIEAWFNADQTSSKVVVRQKENIVDESNISVTLTKNGYEYDAQISGVKFLEQPFFEVIAIKATDFKNRSVTTYLNEGIDVVGKSYNEEPTVQIPSEQRHEGLQTLTRIDKFTDTWENKDGILYTKNEFETWKRITPTALEKSNEGTWNVMTRLNDNFSIIQNYEQSRVMEFAQSYYHNIYDKPFAEINDIFAYDFSETKKDRLANSMLK